MGMLDRSDPISERPGSIRQSVPNQRLSVTGQRGERMVKISLARVTATAPRRAVTYHGGPRRGVARVPETREATKPLVPPRPPVPPVFVDDTGRRGRLLAWASVTCAVVFLLLLVAFWIGQATSSSAAVPPVACHTAVAGDCGAPAGS